MAGFETAIEDVIADGQYTSVEISSQTDAGYVILDFYADALFTTLVEPTLGTVEVRVSANGANFLKVANDTITFPLTDSDYAIPNWRGPTSFVKVTLTGIAGGASPVTHFRASIYRYRSS